MNMGFYNTCISVMCTYELYEYIYLNKGRVISTRQILSCPAGLEAKCFEWDYEDRRFWDLASQCQVARGSTYF